MTIMTSLKRSLCVATCLVVACALTAHAGKKPKKEWKAAQAIDTVVVYEQFLKDHPNTKFTKLAKSRIDTLEEAGRKREEFRAEFAKMATLWTEANDLDALKWLCRAAVGMNESEVRASLGAPIRTEFGPDYPGLYPRYPPVNAPRNLAEKLSRQKSLKWYYYESGGTAIGINFQADRAVGSFEKFTKNRIVR